MQIDEMPLYRGTKTLRARPMSRGDYNAFRGWQMPADEDPNEAGYLVEYLDGGKANVDGHDGYVSWSPADVFEGAYKRVPVSSELGSLLSRAEGEIVGLRRRNEVLEAVHRTVEIFGTALFTQGRNEGMAVDIAWELHQAADRIG
jgi:hypothetical protein